MKETKKVHFNNPASQRKVGKKCYTEIEKLDYPALPKAITLTRTSPCFLLSSKGDYISLENCYCSRELLFQFLALPNPTPPFLSFNLLIIF